MHGDEEGARLDAVVGEDAAQFVAVEAIGGFVHEDAVHPVDVFGPFRLGRRGDAGDGLQAARVFGGVMAAGGDEFVQLLDLGQTDGGLQIGHAIVEADKFVPEVALAAKGVVA